MTEARHDHAVSLLTAAAPTIALLLEREAGDPVSPSPPPCSPPPPAAVTPVVTATPGDPGPLRLAPSLLAAALEGPYPVEVRPVFSPPSPIPCPCSCGFGSPVPRREDRCCGPRTPRLCSWRSAHLLSVPTPPTPPSCGGHRSPIPDDLAAFLRALGALCCPDRLIPASPSRLSVPRRSACREPGAPWDSASLGVLTTPATRLESRSLVCSSPR